MLKFKREVVLLGGAGSHVAAATVAGGPHADGYF
jgi:hypothetical protein